MAEQHQVTRTPSGADPRLLRLRRHWEGRWFWASPRNAVSLHRRTGGTMTYRTRDTHTREESVNG